MARHTGKRTTDTALGGNFALTQDRVTIFGVGAVLHPVRMIKHMLKRAVRAGLKVTTVQVSAQMAIALVQGGFLTAGDFASACEGRVNIKITGLQLCNGPEVDLVIVPDNMLPQSCALFQGDRMIQESDLPPEQEEDEHA